MNHAETLRRLAPDMHGPYKDAMFDAADHIEHMEIVAHQQAHLIEHQQERITQLEAEVHRLRHFAQVIDEHAEAISNESAIALHPPVVVDVVKDGSIGYAAGHGPDDPPRPVKGGGA